MPRRSTSCCSCKQRGYVVSALVEEAATGRIATVRLQRGADSLYTDVLFASSGIEQEIARDAEMILVLADIAVPSQRSGICWR